MSPGSEVAAAAHSCSCLHGIMSGIFTVESKPCRLAELAKESFAYVHACSVQGPPLDPRDRRAAVHHLRARSRDRAMQGRRGRLVPCAQCAAAEIARRMASPHKGGACSL